MKLSFSLAGAFAACFGLAVGVGVAADKDEMVGNIAKNPASYYGKTVTVKGEVERVLAPRVFLLDEDSLLARKDLIVLLPKETAAGLVLDDTILTVTGTVRPSLWPDIDRDYDWFENAWIPKLETVVEIKDRPVLIASSVRMSDGRVVDVK